MARIRSVKPEFWVDGTNLKLSDSCALFFIGLWNFCDDEGKHRYDLNQLVAELGGRWHRGKVKLFVSCLIKSGQLRINSDSTWIQVTGWSHQKIDKPKQPEVKASEILWLSHDESTNAIERSREIDARIGEDRKDRIGEDHSSTGVNPAGNLPVLSKPKSDPSKNIPTWEAYREAYSRRYGTAPIRNASVNAKLAQFVNRIGTEESPLVAEFYLTHNDAFYVKSMHPVGLLLRDAEKLRTEWATGRKMLGSAAREAERVQHNVNVFTEAAARIAAREKRNG